MISPSFILYEHWLFYSLPLAAILTLSALLLDSALRRSVGREGPDSAPHGSREASALALRGGREARVSASFGSREGPASASVSSVSEPSPAGGSIRFTGFFICLALLCATWSLFHFVYYVGVVLILATYVRPHRRALRVVVLTSLAPLACLLMLYAKNAAVF